MKKRLGPTKKRKKNNYFTKLHEDRAKLHESKQKILPLDYYKNNIFEIQFLTNKMA